MLEPDVAHVDKDIPSRASPDGYQDETEMQNGPMIIRHSRGPDQVSSISRVPEIPSEA